MNTPLASWMFSTETLYLLVGIVLLYFGAELLVRSASALALGFGVAPVIIGVTIIAFATTAPELFVSVIGAVTVSESIGLGNIVGSNIANIGLVLGASALIQPLAVDRDLLWRHGSFMLTAVVLLVVLGSDGTLSAPDGALMLVVLAAFTAYLFRYSRRADESVITEEVDTGEAATDLRNVGLFVGSAVLLLVGSRFLVTGSVDLLRQFGFTDLFIGLTLVAFGTSLPELATSVVGAVRDEADFSIGNVIGSNIYNILAVVGILALVVPVEVSASTRSFEFPFLVAFTVVAMGVMAHRHHLSRLNGLFLLAGYGAFIYLLLP